MSLPSKTQIKPLLSKEVQQPENLQFDIMKYDFSKPYVSPVQIKTEYQNLKEVKTECVSDEEVAAELGPNYNPPCSQLTYEADIINAKERILERRKKESIILCWVKRLRSLWLKILLKFTIFIWFLFVILFDWHLVV